MRIVRLHIGIIAIAMLVPLCSVSAHAEGFIKIYGGAAFSRDPGPSLVELEDSAEGGLRGGYWLDGVPWLGLAADVSYFAPDIRLDVPPQWAFFFGRPEQDVHVVPITPLLLLRTPVLGNERLGVQPYAGIGPGFFVTILDGDRDEVGMDIGIDARAGVNLHLTPWFLVFSEYRFTSYEPDDLPGFDFDTHHVTGGIGLLF